MQRDPAEMWAAYKASDAPGSTTADAYTSWHFGSGAELAAFGHEAEPEMPVVCERFEVVYPEGDGEGHRR